MQGRLIMRQPTVTICTNGNCAPKSVAAALLLHLQTRINLEPALGHVIANTIECFGVCHSGPIACIQPGGGYYERVDEALLDRILDEHIGHGLPISTHQRKHNPQHPVTRPPSSGMRHHKKPPT